MNRIDDLSLAAEQVAIWARFRDFDERHIMYEDEKEEIAKQISQNPLETWYNLHPDIRRQMAEAWQDGLRQYPTIDHAPDCEFCGDDQRYAYIVSDPHDLILCGSCTQGYQAGWHDAMQRMEQVLSPIFGTNGGSFVIASFEKLPTWKPKIFTLEANS